MINLSTNCISFSFGVRQPLAMPDIDLWTGARVLCAGAGLAVPNPFNPTTTLRFDLGYDGRVQLDIYDQRGRRIATPVSNTVLMVGSHEVTWHGVDARGHRVASGVYFARLKLDGEVVGQTRRLVLLK